MSKDAAQLVDDPVRPACLDVDREGPRLSDVAGIDPPAELPVAPRDAVPLEAGGGRSVEPVEDVADRIGRLRLQWNKAGSTVLVLEVAHEHAERREHARVVGDHDRRDAELRGEAAGVERTGAAERDERELARVVTALDGDEPDRLGHERLSDGDDARGRGRHVDAESGRHRLERAGRCSDIEADDSVGEILGHDPTEDDVGVRDRRILPTASVAGGPRIGPGTLRADPRMTAGIDPRDAAATRADLDEVDDRTKDRIPAGDRHCRPGTLRGANLELGQRPCLAIEDQPDLGSRATHVERDRVADAERRRDPDRG